MCDLARGISLVLLIDSVLSVVAARGPVNREGAISYSLLLAIVRGAARGDVCCNFRP